jgi:tRNA threonylcarbamoyladenosine biosynthesis protein TsaB
MTKLLAIDASTEACSAAILYHKEEFERFQYAPRAHASLLLPMIDSLLNEASLRLSDLDAIVCCIGPGAFTGLRIAISVAKSLAFASNLPCIGVSSLAMLAVQAFKSNPTKKTALTFIDARMQEVYFGIYQNQENGRVKLLTKEQVLCPTKITWEAFPLCKHLQISDTLLVGQGWNMNENKTFESFIESSILHPRALDMLSIAEHHFLNKKTLSSEELLPIYLRNNVAKKSNKVN